MFAKSLNKVCKVFLKLTSSTNSPSASSLSSSYHLASSSSYRLASSSSSSSSSPTLSPLLSSSSSNDVASMWPVPLTLCKSAGSYTVQLTESIEEYYNENKRNKIEDLILHENHSEEGNVDLSCSMQSNCPYPYLSNNEGPSSLNMPHGSTGKQCKYLGAERNAIYPFCE